MQGIFVGKVRIGSVLCFAGEPLATRWQAYAPREKPADPEKREGFRTRAEAIAWLTRLYNETGRAAA